MDIFELIQERAGNADVYLDVQDYLQTKSPEKVLYFCCQNDVRVDSRSGRWIMPLGSVELVSL